MNDYLSSQESELFRKLQEFFVDINSYRSPYAEAIGDTSEIIFPLIRKSSIKAASISAGFGILPGRISILGVLPEVFLLLRLQARMVKDIAIILGKEKFLTNDVLLYCLFKENHPDFFNTFIRTTSTKILIKPITIEIIINLFSKLIRIKAEKQTSKKSKFAIPIFSSVIGGSLSFIDTQMVGLTANNLFLNEVQFESPYNPEIISEKEIDK